MLELVFKNIIPQHEKSNDRTKMKFHVENQKQNQKQNILYGFSLQN